jgi:hypothetical protein
MKQIIKAIGMILLFCTLGACAMGGEYEKFTFWFTWNEIGEDVVLDYKIWNDKFILFQADREYSTKDRPVPGIRAEGLGRPEFIYVKWRNYKNYVIMERTIDLRRLLPMNIKDKIFQLHLSGEVLALQLGEFVAEPPGTPGSSLSDSQNILKFKNIYSK